MLHSLEDAVMFAETSGEQELFVIGGGEVFNLAMQLANRLYLTQVHARVPADVFFPEIDISGWQELESAYTPAGEKDQFPTTYRLLENKGAPIS